MVLEIEVVSGLDDLDEDVEDTFVDETVNGGFELEVGVVVEHLLDFGDSGDTGVVVVGLEVFQYGFEFGVVDLFGH